MDIGEVVSVVESEPITFRMEVIPPVVQRTLEKINNRESYDNQRRSWTYEKPLSAVASGHS